MKSAYYAMGLLSVWAGAVACSGDDDATDDGPSSSSGQVSSSSGGSSSSSSGGASSSGSTSGGSSSSSSSGSVAFECEETPFAYPAADAAPLAASTYEEVLTLDAAFPFDVVGFYTVPAGVDAASVEWGEHGGPVAYTNEDGNVVVHRLEAPVAPTGALADGTLTIAQPPDLFDPAYANYPPVASLPGDRYLLSYTSTAVDGIVPGLGYLYAGAVLQQRAHSNAIFAAVGAERGEALRIFYHAFSPFEAAPSQTSTSALYVTDVAGSALFGAGVPSFALVTTGEDNGGPVVKDASGSVVVATSGATVNLRALSRCGALAATTTQNVLPFHTYATAGTDALAVVPPAGDRSGFVVNVSYPGPAVEVLATPFTRSGETFATAGADLVDPLAAGPDATALGVFADDRGSLWVGLSTDEGGYLAKLQRRVD